MRLLVGLVLAAAMPAFAAVAAPRAVNPAVPDGPAWTLAICDTAGHVTPTAGGQARARKLTEAPSVNMYRTVLRRVGGCSVPVIVRYDVDGQARKWNADPRSR